MKLIKSNSFSLIIILVGSNDITHFTNLKSLEGSINDLLSEAKRVSVKVILTTCGSIGSAKICPKFLTYLWRAYYMKLRKTFIFSTNKNNVLYAEYFKQKSKDQFYLNSKKYQAEDFFHPSSEGYAIWYIELKKAILKVI